MELQEPFADPWLEVDADRTHIADDLLGLFFETEKQEAIAGAAARIHETCRNGGFTGSRRAGCQNAAPPIKALAAQHAIQPGNTARYSFGRRIVVQAQ